MFKLKRNGAYAKRKRERERESEGERERERERGGIGVIVHKAKKEDLSSDGKGWDNL